MKVRHETEGNLVIGDRIREARKQLRMTQATLAQTTGIPLSTLKGYELSHKKPGTDSIESLVKIGINANWLLTGQGAILLKDMAGSPPPLREEELKAAVETVEEALQATNRVMIPAKKAQMITAIYKLFIEDEEGKINKATVLQLVKTAA